MRSIDIKCFALCDWVECDLIHLERIDTSINIADHLTNLSRESCFIGMLIFYSDTSLPNTPQYTNKQLQHTAINLTRPWTNSYPSPLRHPCLVKWPGFMPLHTTMCGEILGSSFCDMTSTIHHYVADCGGVLVYT